MPDILELENDVNGSDSERDRSGSDGASDGSASGSGSGNGGSADGNGGNVDGNDRNVSGSDSRTGTDSGSGSGSGNVDILDIEPPNGTISADSGKTGSSRSERIRRPIRLGSAVRDSVTDRSGSGTGTGSAEPELDREPVIRLGAKKQGAPRSNAKTENTSDMKLSEMKDLISMFLDTAFEIPATILRQDFWKLSKDENKMLTDAVSAYIKSMPKDKSSWLMTFIQDNLPLVNLLMVGFFIVSDRIKGSIAIAQVTKSANRFNENVNAETNVNTNGGGVRLPMDDIFS